MAGDILVLDTIVFTDFAIPSKIGFGMKQMLGKTTLIGGDKVLDAMGPEPAPLKWQGRFRGPFAASNSEACRSLAAAGNQVSVTWGQFAFIGVVLDYQVEYEAYFEVGYTIEVEVFPDNGFVGTLVSTLDSLVGIDMSNAMTALGQIV